MGRVTRKQTDIFNFIKSCIDQDGCPPTVREICKHTGLKSPSTVYTHLVNLRENKLIEMPDGKKRSIRILGEDDGFKAVPILGSIAAGDPILAEEHIEGYVPVEKSRIKSGEYFALKVSGNSMTGAGILDGDIVVVRRQPRVENGEIAAVLVGTEATVKRVYDEGKMLRLQPENPDFVNAYTSEGSILGRVDTVIRYY